jgi:uncharacterized protein YabN with tetrapyrrole methylase and pyrophosphatase domain
MAKTTKRPPPPLRRGTAGAIKALTGIMERLRAPDGCPWDQEQDHRTLRWHAVEEVYELLDAIEAGDEHEMVEELGDLLLQIIFHCQLGKERGAFDLEQVTRRVVQKLIHRHPHVFGDVDAKNVDQVLGNWEKLKRAEKVGTKHERGSALDGIPRHLPALLHAEKLLKKAKRAKLINGAPEPKLRLNQTQLGEELFRLAETAHAKGWSAENLLRAEIRKREKTWRQREKSGE